LGGKPPENASWTKAGWTELFPPSASPFTSCSHRPADIAPQHFDRAHLPRTGFLFHNVGAWRRRRRMRARKPLKKHAAVSAAQLLRNETCREIRQNRRVDNLESGRCKKFYGAAIFMKCPYKFLLSRGKHSPKITSHEVQQEKTL
jgi:hypothetical protein